jgi:hypothetical protein
MSIYRINGEALLKTAAAGVHLREASLFIPGHFEYPPESKHVVSRAVSFLKVAPVMTPDNSLADLNFCAENVLHMVSCF